MVEESSKRRRAGEEEVTEPSPTKDDPIVKLNVGGKRIQTRQSTLTWGSRYFRNLLDGPFKVKEDEIFLDCCPDCFQHILYYFRHRKLRSSAPLEEVEDIASLYSIESLFEEINRRRAQEEHQKQKQQAESARLKAIERLTGAWCYPPFSPAHYFIIHEKKSALWYYHDSIEAGERLQGEVKNNGDAYYVQETWGTVHFATSGGVIFFGYDREGRVDPNTISLDYLAIRKQQFFA